MIAAPEITDVQADALKHARHLIEHGVPVFLAAPAMRDGEWDPTGGDGGTGYRLPKGWQKTVPDVAVLDRWRPGDALCGVMGHGVDLLDVDPRNGGDVTQTGSRDADMWPKSYGTATTPSGGTHDFMASLGVPSSDGIARGLDVKAGHDGKGHGFAFLAPTDRASKVTGQIATYRWIKPPNLDGLDEGDDTGAAIAAMITGTGDTSTPFTTVKAPFVLPDRILAGDREKVFYDYACSLRGKGIKVSQATRLVEQAWRERVDQSGHPFTLKEALSKIDGAWGSYDGPGEKPGDSQTQGGKPPGSAHRRRHHQTRRVLWGWTGRLALGTLALLAGREGLGKSTVALWIAARITRGELPGEHAGHPKATLVCATEDSWEHTIVPRLIAAGANLALVYRVEILNADDIHLGLSLVRDLAQLEATARATGAALLILDPLMSRLDTNLDTHKDGDVRLALEPLVAVADRTGMTVLGLIHHNKSGSSDPLQLVMTSKAFTAVARSVHTVIPDPDDDTGARLLFGTPKNNLGRGDLPTLSFAVVGHPIETDDGTAWTGRVEWATKCPSRSPRRCAGQPTPPMTGQPRPRPPPGSATTSTVKAGVRPAPTSRRPARRRGTACPPWTGPARSCASPSTKATTRGAPTGLPQSFQQSFQLLGEAK